MDAQGLLDYFNSNTAVSSTIKLAEQTPDATIITLEGRMFPVEIAYLAEPTPDYVREAVRTIWSIHLQVCFVQKVRT